MDESSLSIGRVNPYAAGVLFGRYKMMQKQRMAETLTHGFSSESTQRELSNEFQHDRVQMVLKNRFALDESSRSIGRVKCVKDVYIGSAIRLSAKPRRPAAC